LKVGLSVGNPPPPIAFPILDIAFGKFFMRSSGEVKASILAPKGLNGGDLSAPALKSLGLAYVT
jgi:hypothetical protein